MSIISHPNDALLRDYHECALSPGQDLVVQIHLETCSHCRDTLCTFDGGVPDMESAVATEPVSDKPLILALARIDIMARRSPGAEARKRGRPFLSNISLPAPLQRVDVANRYWAAPGVWIAPIEFVDAPKGSKTFLIHVRGGMSLPQHTHKGMELTLVLSGRFADETGHFGAGDLVVCGDSHSHAPAAIEDCLCLIASDAAIKMKTWKGKLVQPFARI